MTAIRTLFPLVDDDGVSTIRCRVCGYPAETHAYTNDQLCKSPECGNTLVIEETLYAFTGLVPEEVEVPLASLRFAQSQECGCTLRPWPAVRVENGTPRCVGCGAQATWYTP